MLGMQAAPTQPFQTISAASFTPLIQGRPSEMATATGHSANPNAMTKEELKRVAQGCLEYLCQLMQQSNSSAAGSMSAGDALMFAHVLVTGTLALGMAPRSQILRQLQIGSSFVKEQDGRYWVCILAEQSKNGKPTRFALPTVLTPAYDMYLNLVRPCLMHNMAHGAHSYVFVKRDGSAPRTDFSSSTCIVTSKLLGRGINPHAFRSAVITMFSSSGANQAEMDTLAAIMAHDPGTARQFYFKPAHSQAALDTSQRMLDQLLS